MSNLVANLSFFPVDAITHDEDLIDPMGMAIIDNNLWVANFGSSVLTHYSSTGIKLAPNRVIPFASSKDSQLISWAILINANIVGLALDNTNILIALGMPVTTFVAFRNRIQSILTQQVSMISQNSLNKIYKVYLDYVNAVLPPQTFNDITSAVESFNQLSFQRDSAPISSVIANPTQGFILSWIKEIGQPAYTAASYLLSTTTDGTIFGYSPLFQSESEDLNDFDGFGIVTYDQSALGGFFTGLAIANNNLYVTDLFSKSIIVFDNNFNKLTGYPFLDQDNITPLPSDFAPYNIFNIGGLLFVVYAKINAQNDGVINGPGNGFINIFDTFGQFVQRFITQGNLNSPWSIIVAPTGFGSFAGQILVGNQGDGRILAYQTNGTFKSTVNNLTLTPFIFKGLNGLVADNNNVFVSSSTTDQYGFVNGLITAINGTMVSN